MASSTRESPDTDDGTDDVTLREEATLGQCLMRILNSSKDTSPLQSQAQPRANVHTNRHAYCHGFPGSNNCLSNHVNAFECTTCKLISCSDDGRDYLQLSEEDKLVKWRAAGAALHRALIETEVPAQASSQYTCRKISSGHGSRSKLPTGFPGEDDPMNAMLEEFKSHPCNFESLDVLNSSSNSAENSRPRKSYREIIKEHKLKKRKSPVSEVSQENVSPSLLSVREKIREIRSRIKDKDGPAPKSQPKVIIAKSNSNKERGRLSRAASKELNTSSDSGEDGDVARSRCVHKCRRTTTNGRMKLSSEVDIPLSSHEVDMPGHSIDAYEYNKVVPSEEELAPRLNGSLSESDDVFDIQFPADMSLTKDGSSDDDDSDTLARKLEVIAGRRMQKAGQVSSEADEKANILSTETDSLPNLADIESSNVSDEPDTLGETGSDNDELRCCRNVSELPSRDFGSMNACRTSHLQHEEPYCCSGYSPHFIRSQRFSACRESSVWAHSHDDSGYLCNSGVEEDELEDLIDLDLSGTVVSDSDTENGARIELCPEDLDSLPRLISEESSYCESEDVDADDEFECECSLCQQRRVQDFAASQEDQSELQNAAAHIDSYVDDTSPGDSDPPHYSINMAELTPLDVLLMREGRREVLELFQNVIMQMLSVYPDLLGDQAPPPAPAILINSLPMMIIQQRHLDADFICPICLCNFEVEEEVRCLPCQHLFHTLCIQAWLGKSGTCPVCRHILISGD